MAAYSFHVVFQNIYASFKNSVVYINTSISKMLAAGLESPTIELSFCDFRLTAPPPIMNLWFNMTWAHFSKSIKPETKPCWYPENLVSGKRISW